MRIWPPPAANNQTPLEYLISVYLDASVPRQERISAAIAAAPYIHPARPDFHFCGSPAARRPYCEHHRAMAYRQVRAAAAAVNMAQTFQP